MASVVAIDPSMYLRKKTIAQLSCLDRFVKLEDSTKTELRTRFSLGCKDQLSKLSKLISKSEQASCSQPPIVKSRLAVEIVTVKPKTTSIKDATVIIKNVVLPTLATTRNSMRKITNTNSDNAWSMMEITDVRVALKVSMYRNIRLVRINRSLIVSTIIRVDGTFNS